MDRLIDDLLVAIMHKTPDTRPLYLASKRYLRLVPEKDLTYWKAPSEKKLTFHLPKIPTEEPLWQFAEAGNLQMVEFMHAKCPNRHITGKALPYACFKGHFPVVKFLCSEGALLTYYADQALVNASEAGHFQIVEFLVENGVDVNAWKCSVIKNACSIGHFQMVEFLVKKGATIPEGRNGVIAIAQRKGYFKIVKLLRSAGGTF